MISGIYLIINKINGKKYFGQTTDLDRREKEYFNYEDFPNDHLKNAFNKYGKENFNFKIIKCCKEKYLDRFEKLYIRIYDTTNREKGYNKDSGGNLNKHRSEETKHKISESLKGREAWNKGKTLSEEHRKNLSESHIGNTHSEEAKQKISESMTGKPKSKKHIENVSKSLKGKYVRENNPIYKDYVRIIKQGFQGDKQIYAIKFQGKKLKQSIHLHKLYKWWGKNYPNEFLYLEI